MTHKELDLLFPFVVLAYGLVMTFVLNSKVLMRLADEKFPPEMVTQMNTHRTLALIWLVIGALWSLQNIWIS